MPAIPEADEVADPASEEDMTPDQIIEKLRADKVKLQNIVKERDATIAELQGKLAEQGEEASDSLKDSLEGSFRLKRLLEGADDDAGPAKKVSRMSAAKESMLVKKLLMKWGIPLESYQVVTYFLEQCSVVELETLCAGTFVPPQWDKRSLSECIAHHVIGEREKKMLSGFAQDILTTFKHRWGLDKATIDRLKELSHKDLRYVTLNHDGKKPIDEVIDEAASHNFDPLTTDAVLPDEAGHQTLSRFSRLEIIDPVLDCAVFGDANLTFSIKLAKHRKALGHVGRVIATTFEELPTLQERYKEIDLSIELLEEHFAEVYHGVDCTKIAVNPAFKGLEASLGACYYNFPHSGAVQRFFDGHPIVNWRHENLMRLFFRALRHFVKPGGIVKVSSNGGAVGVRYSYIVGSAVQNEFTHTETVPFTEWSLHRYGRSYGDKRDITKRPDAVNNESYNAQAGNRDMVYCFRYEPSGKTLGPQEVRVPPTLDVIMACTDGPFKDFGLHQMQAKKTKAMELHKRFVTEISGTHVG